MIWRVPYIDLGAQYQSLRHDGIDSAIYKVMASGKYSGGEEVERFESSMASYLGVKHVVSVASGSDALRLAVIACGIGEGDEVFTTDYAFVASVEAIVHAGAKQNLKGITKRTKAVMPVHMNGRYAPLQGKSRWLIEDACQALGARYKGIAVGTEGIGCFSVSPMKILSCAGYGGFVATDDSKIADAVTLLRNHGSRDVGVTFECFGFHSRLPNLQAAILNVKLPYLDKWIARRRWIAGVYEKELPEWIKKPPAPSDGPYFDTYSNYVIGGSPEFLAHMRGKGIECFSHIRTDVVSLPIYPEMPESDIEIVIAAVKSYG